MAIKIAQLTSEQLSKSEIVEKVKAIANDITVHDQMSSAWDLAKKLERQTRSLIDSSPEIYKQYQRIIAQLKFIAISFLTDEQLLQLIEKGYLKALKGGVDIEQKIKDYLGIKSVFSWDQFRTEVITRLKENQEKIGKKSIKQWLTDYDNEFGARKNTSMERTKFISKSPEVKNLNETEERYLSSLLTFYDYIKISHPLPYLNISEVSLKEYFKNLGIPLPEEEKKEKLKLPARKKGEIKKEEMKQKEFEKKKGEREEKDEKKKEKKEKKERKIERKEEKTKKEKPDFFSPWRKKVSPYAKERELRPSLPKKEKVKTEPAKKPKLEPKTKTGAEPEPVKIPPHRIRTMKEDIAKAKKKPIPEKPKSKTRDDNIVDLSGKE